MVMALLLTLSRGGYLGFAAEILIVVVLLASLGRIRVPGSLGRRRAGRALLAVGIILIAVLALPPTREAADRVVKRAASTIDLQDTSIQDRLDLWAVGFRITFDHPILGTGPDSYALVFPDYRDTTLPPERAALVARFRPESPHDVYLALASGLGLPALVCYLALIAGAAFATVRTLRTRAPEVQLLGVALVAALVGHLVTDGFMTAELTGSWLFWVFLGSATGINSRFALRRQKARSA
jgi:O-antigen ligase